LQQPDDPGFICAPIAPGKQFVGQCLMEQLSYEFP
jgi:hypothetical protein